MKKDWASKIAKFSFVAGGCSIPCLGPLVPQDTSNFCGILQLIDNFINFILTIAPMIAVAAIVYGGFRIITSGGSPQGLESGYEAIKSAFIGLLIVFGSWLIISTILHVAGAGDASTWFSISC